MPEMISEERLVYRTSRQSEVRCRMWYQVSRFADALCPYFLVGTEELDELFR